MGARLGPFDLGRLVEPPSAETHAFNQRLRETLKGLPQAHEVDPVVTRAARAAGRSIFPAPRPLDSSAWQAIPGPAGGPNRVRVTLPPHAPRGVYLHVHGGGWTFGDPHHLDGWMAEFAAATGLAVCAVHYRLAPENVWPACADDVEAAALWLASGGAAGFGAGPLFIGGDSAGAHLSAVALRRLAARGLADRFAGAVLTYGVYDLRLTPSMAAWGPESLILSTPTVEWFVDNLTGGDRALRADPDLSPLLGDLRGFPPSLLQVGAADPLIDDTLFMACRLAAADVDVETAIYPGGVHAFDAFDLTIARELGARTVGWLRARLG
jgi:acetyl esterase/lipase